MSNINYNGRSEFSRPRTLTEQANNASTQGQFTDAIRPETDTRQEVVDQIFEDLARTYLKGDKLKKAIRALDPAQYIPIEPDNEEVSAAAQRLSREQSQDGTVITYNMYTNAIDSILETQWSLRVEYMKANIPATVKGQTRRIESVKSRGSNGADLIKEFLNQNGIAGTIIGMLTLAPFQTIIFQGLTVEEGAKGIQVAQIPIGIALLIELGIKAEQILKLLKTAKISTPQVEQQVQRISTDPVARAEALAGAGIDMEAMRKVTKVSDSEIIMEYVSEYYKRYGGLDRPNGYLTIDHWIAYSNVAKNQQTLRGALNTADTYSPKFQTIREEFSQEQVADILDAPSKTKTSKISVQLVSATRAIRERSNDLYDDIVDALQFTLTDREVCCLVQLFGTYNDVGLMKTIATILRILAVDLSGDIVRIDNFIRRLLASYFQDALFEIATQINEFYQKTLLKLTKKFTVDLGDELSYCGGLLTVGWALMNALRTMMVQLDALISEISAIIGNYGQANSGSWQVAADRRYLLGIARILEVLAQRIELAYACENSNTKPPFSTSDPSDGDADAILSIIEIQPPVLKFSSQDEQRYFSNRQPKVSERLKYTYGKSTVQNINDSTTEQRDSCADNTAKAAVDKLIQDFISVFRDE